MIGIADEAFFKTKCIKSVVIPETIEYIGRGAFLECINLQKVTLADGSTPLRAKDKSYFYIVFQDCDLREVYVGRDMIHTGLFSLQDNLSAVSFGHITIATGFNDCPALTSVTLPSSVRIIANSAFARTGITGITLHEGLETIEQAAFEGTQLAEISFPSTLTHIDGQSFGYTPLKQVTIPENLTSFADAFYGSQIERIEVLAPVGELPLNCFASLTKLTEIKLPESLTSLGTYSFRSCYSLTKFECPASLVSIGKQAFYECRNLDTIIFNENLTSIGERCFDVCDKLKNVVCHPVVAPQIDPYSFYYTVYGVATLYTPAGSDSYMADGSVWKNFVIRKDISEYSSLTPVHAEGERTIVRYYDLKGNSSAAPLPGINIVRYSDGSAAKVR